MKQEGLLVCSSKSQVPRTNVLHKVKEIEGRIKQINFWLFYRSRSYHSNTNITPLMLFAVICNVISNLRSEVFPFIEQSPGKKKVLKNETRCLDSRGSKWSKTRITFPQSVFKKGQDAILLNFSGPRSQRTCSLIWASGPLKIEQNGLK